MYQSLWRANGQCDDAITLCNYGNMRVIWDFFHFQKIHFLQITVIVTLTLLTSTWDLNPRKSGELFFTFTFVSLTVAWLVCDLQNYVTCIFTSSALSLLHLNLYILLAKKEGISLEYIHIVNRRSLYLRNSWDIKEIFVILLSYGFTAVMDGLMALTEECQEREEKEQAVN